MSRCKSRDFFKVCMFKIGDVVIFDHPEYEKETITLKERDLMYDVWSAEENDIYWYKEEHLRHLTKLDKALK